MLLPKHVWIDLLHPCHALDLIYQLLCLLRRGSSNLSGHLLMVDCRLEPMPILWIHRLLLLLCQQRQLLLQVKWATVGLLVDVALLLWLHSLLLVLLLLLLLLLLLQEHLGSQHGGRGLLLQERVAAGCGWRRLLLLR